MVVCDISPFSFVLEECGPYVALKHWLQRSEVPLPTVRDVPMPSAERAIAAAQHAIEVADEAGARWLEAGGVTFTLYYTPAKWTL